MCTICHAPLLDTTPTLALKCAHVFHKACIDTWCDVTKTNLEDLTCPSCKSSAMQMSIKEQSLLAPKERSRPFPRSWCDDGSAYVVEEVDASPSRASGSATPAHATDDTPSDAQLFWTAARATDDTPSDDSASAALADSSASAPADDASAHPAIVEAMSSGQVSGASHAESESAIIPDEVEPLSAMPKNTASHAESVLATIPDEDGPLSAMPKNVASHAENALAIIPVEVDLQLAMPKKIQAGMQGFSIDAVASYAEHDVVSKPICCDCLQECTSFRIKSKGDNGARCTKCDYTRLRIHRDKGAGFSHKLMEIPKETLVEFFKASHQMTAREQRTSYDLTMSKHSTRERYFERGGAFKPLSVWEREGYDVTPIATKSEPEDVMPCRLFGLVYRVPTLTVGQRGTDGHANKSAAHSRWVDNSEEKRLRAAPSIAAADAEEMPAAASKAASAAAPSRAASAAAPSRAASAAASSRAASAKEEMPAAVKEEPTTDDDSSGSSSSSSLERDGNKKDSKKNKKVKLMKKKRKKQEKKQKKEAKKLKAEQVKLARQEREDKKAATIAAKKAESEEKAEQKRIESAANKISSRSIALAKADASKLDGAIASLQKTFRAPGADRVDDSAKKPLENRLRELTVYHSRAILQVSGLPPGDEYVPCPELKEMIANTKKLETIFMLIVRTMTSSQ
jgi:Zn finger protein HypA/HybF involved in hydrogenase expression